MTRNVSYVSNGTPNREFFSRQGSNSPIINGRLALRENVLVTQRTNVLCPKIQYVQRTSPNPEGSPSVQTQFFKTDAPFVLVSGRPPELLSRSQVLNELRMELRNQIRETDVNLAVAYAEKSQTASLIAGKASAIHRAAKAVKRGRYAEASRHLGIERDKRSKRLKPGDTFAKNWLEFSYGWAPLYGDMYGSMVAFDKTVLRRPDIRRTVKASRSVEKESIFTFTAGSPVSVSPVGKTSTNQRYKMVCRYRVTNAFTHTVDSLGILNPALVVWEKVPYSFVIDWFVPIGDWLAQLPPLWGVTVDQVFTTFVSESTSSTPFQTKQTFVWVSQTETKPGKPPVTIKCLQERTAISSAASVHRFYVERFSDNLNATLALPRPQLPTSWKKATSAIALLQQFLSRNRALR